MPFEEVGVRAVLEGVAAYERDSARVNQATQRIVTEAALAARQAQSQAQLMGQLGSRMRETGQQALFLGAALAGPGIAAVHFAVQFESAFAGVRKTVDATEAEFETLRTGILDLTRSIPTSAGGLASIAEAAGQLGVAKQDILDFTTVTAQLAATTNLTTEEAATSLARFANILQIPQAELGNVASALVDLGNKGAATESEILEISLRLAGAGKVIGISADEVLGFGNALSSLGINAEAGGSAFSRVFVEIAKSVQTGGADLQKFADVAGLTGAQFAQAFRDDAAGAVIQFVEGLGRITAEGGATFAVLEDLSLGDIRLRDALLRASGAGDLLRTSLANGATAFRANTALTTEFGKRLNTTSAQFQLLVNDIQRIAISAGNVLLPSLRAVIGVLREVGQFLEGMPDFLKAGAAGFSLLAGGAVIAIGALGILSGSLLAIAATFPIFITGANAAATAMARLAVARLALAAGASVGGVPLIVGAVAITGAVIAYRKLTEESRAADAAVNQANDSLQKSNEALAKTLRDVAKAEVERRDAADDADKPRRSTDARIGALDAERKATEDLRISIENLAKTEAEESRLAAERRTGKPIPAPSDSGPPVSTAEGRNLLEGIRRDAGQGGGAGFRRGDVAPEFKADFDLAAEITGVERIDVSVLAFIRALDSDSRTLIKSALAVEKTDLERGKAAKVTLQSAINAAQREAADRGPADLEPGPRPPRPTATLTQAQGQEEVAIKALAQAQITLSNLQRAAVPDSDALAGALRGVGTAQLALTEAAVRTTAAETDLEVAYKVVDAARAHLTRVQQSGASTEDDVAAATRELEVAIAGVGIVAGSSGAALNSLAGRLSAAIDATTDRRRDEAISGEIRAATGAPGETAAETLSIQERADVLFDAFAESFKAKGEQVPETKRGEIEAGLRAANEFNLAEARRLTAEATSAAAEAERDAASAAREAEQAYRESIAGRTEEIMKQTREGRSRALGEALGREAFELVGPGDSGVADIQRQQAKADAIFQRVRDRLLELGVEIPEGLIEVFDRMAETAESEGRKKGETIGGILGFLIARRLGQGLDPGGGLISVPPPRRGDPGAGLLTPPVGTQAALAGAGVGGQPQVNIENVNIGPGTTTGDIAQGFGVGLNVAYRGGQP